MGTQVAAGTVIRNATSEDLPAIMDVERDWPRSERAPVEKMAARLERFPEGVFVGEVEGRVVGVTTSCPTVYEPDHVDVFTSWDAVTNKGWLRDRDEIAGANAVYIVSTGIKKAYRGSGLFRPLIGRQIDLSRRLGLRYCVTGVILEGYAAYLRDNAPLPAADYALLRPNGCHVDPLLEKARHAGFRVPDARHVVPGYFASEGALDWSAIMVYDAEKDLPPTLSGAYPGRARRTGKHHVSR